MPACEAVRFLQESESTEAPLPSTAGTARPVSRPGSKGVWRYRGAVMRSCERAKPALRNRLESCLDVGRIAVRRRLEPRYSSEPLQLELRIRLFQRVAPELIAGVDGQYVQ